MHMAWDSSPPEAEEKKQLEAILVSVVSSRTALAMCQGLT